jgi:DNA-binding GntR family transcriptional regulator
MIRPLQSNKKLYTKYKTGNSSKIEHLLPQLASGFYRHKNLVYRCGMPCRPRKLPRSHVSTEVIVDRITEAVLEQRLPLGAKLVEEKLCGIFGVSRTKVRQALNRLSQNRLVTLRPRRGAFLTQPSPREAQQVFEARRVVEREIVERFVQNATETHFAELEAHLAAEQRAIDSGNIPLRNRLLGVFHIKIAECAGNEVLAQILSDLVSRSSLVTLLFQSNQSVLCSTDEHASVLEALRRRDSKLAIRLMNEHLVHVERDLARVPKAGARIDLEEALALPRTRSKPKVAA